MDLEFLYFLILVIAGGYSQLVEETRGNSAIKDSTTALRKPIHKISKNGSVTNNEESYQTFKTSSQNTNSTINPVGNEHGPIEVPSVNASMLENVRSNSTSEYKNTSGSKRKSPVEQGVLISVKMLLGEESVISITETSNRKRLPEILKTNNLNVYSIDYLYNESLVFFTARDRLFRATLEGRSIISNPEVVVGKGVEGPVRLAIDWVHKKLYWMADRYQTVMAADLDGTNKRLLFDNIRTFSYPNNIVVDPYEGLLFFVSDYAVYKSDLNGENVTAVALEGNTPGEEGRGVRCVALDRAARKLYFSGRNHQGSENTCYLARSDYDGSYVEDFNTTGLNDIYSMEVLGDTLYFAHHKYEGCNDEVMTASIESLGEFRPQKIFVPRHCKSNIWSIKVYHPCVQKSSDDKYCSSFYG